MAIYHLHAKPVSRGKGKSAVAKAAYNARAQLIDERTGEMKDYSRHGDEPVFSGIFAPKDAPEWAHDRAALWNAVEAREKRKDAQLAVEITGAFPHEFTDQQREWLIKDFVREEFTRKSIVVDVSIHPPPREPEREGDKPNHHFHALAALREIGPDGFGERVLNSGSLKENAAQIEHLREKWENLVNRHLERHGFEDRIDRRTLEEQGIDREPTKHRGPTVDAMERRGMETERGREQPQPEAARAAHQEQKPDREAEWWQRIEQAIERGGGYEEARRQGWLSQPYGPDRLDELRDRRKEIVGMRQDLDNQLDRELAPEYRAALREMAGELRDLHHDTSKQIAMLALEQSAYEPKVIELGRARLSDFAQTIEGAGREAADLIGGVADMAGKAVEAVVDFFLTPSLPTPEVMQARREAREAKIEQAEINVKRGMEDDVHRAQTNPQDQAKREQEEQEYKRKQERELHPNERERER